MNVRKRLLSPWAKPLLMLLLALPAGWLIYAAFSDLLGANPAEALIRQTGDWTLRGLCVVLAITPLREITGTPALLRFRRTLGVSTFIYACLHMLCYAWFDQGLAFDDIWRDILKRPFIWLGFGGLLAMLPLALTSFNAAIRWMGVKRWQTLHRLVYATAFLAVLHFFWMRSGKNDFAEVGVYAAILGSLLAWRVWKAVKAR
jgi:sulfoxide reductase heme-binding subunit YedZ